MSVHIQCPCCGVCLSFGQTECPVCGGEFPCREEDIIYDSEGYKERKIKEEDKIPVEFEEEERKIIGLTIEETGYHVNPEFDKDSM